MQLNKKYKGSFALFMVLMLPIIFLVVLILIGRAEAFEVRNNLKGIMDIAIETATDNAMVMQSDNSSEQFCVILDTYNGRTKTYKLVTNLFEENLRNTLSDKLGSEIIIESIGTTNGNNAWNYNTATSSFDGITSALKRSFAKGKSDMILKGYYRPEYLGMMPSIWKGFSIDVEAYGSCSITEN